jgi:hypothetical protein
MAEGAVQTRPESVEPGFYNWTNRLVQDHVVTAGVDFCSYIEQFHLPRS